MVCVSIFETVPASRSGAKPNRPPGLGVVEYGRQDAHHAPLVVLVRAEHVEEFEPDPLRRKLRPVCEAVG